MNSVAAAGVLLIAQFIRPRVVCAESRRIFTQFHPPQEVANILRASCYDCHSNGTRYPWYAEVQPLGWWLDGHITDGKRHLNFPNSAQYTKLEEIADRSAWGNAASYLVSTDSKLSPEGKELLRSVGSYRQRFNESTARQPRTAAVIPVTS
jgi:hypothetical protein